MTATDHAEVVPRGSMPLVGHLAELRSRIIWSVLAVALGGSLGFVWGEQISDVLEGALPPGVTLIQIELGDGFPVRLQIALVVGIILAMPVLHFHIWRF